MRYTAALQQLGKMLGFINGYEKVQRQKMFDDILDGIDQYLEYMKVIEGYVEKIK